MKGLFFFVAVVTGVVTYSQQDAQYTQYMYNTVSVNPGYAGSRDALSIVGLHRSQWVGLEGAPETQTLSAHAPLDEDKKIGLGFSIINDVIGEGVSQETSFDAIFSYDIKTSQQGILSFGLNAGIHLLNIDFTRLSQYNIEFDQSNNIDNKLSPRLGTGFYYYTDKFYAGISVPNLLETKHFDRSSGGSNAASFLAKEQMNFYFMGGYVFNLDESWEFKPAILTKLVYGTPLQVDMSANFWYKKKLVLGGAYRWDAAFSFLTGLNISEDFMVGLSYDREVTDLGNTTFNDGSFEIVLRVELFKRFYEDCNCLRFF
ncbi:PorP/SprF family type IX secretion system membrane protein [Abyssalbus ytuae]|uniref:Type IX secretion system membrane protein PorP/SprF n=1 Tax=Abyssalbus ytuae TaxID=2926907 RepID=A0A9E7CUX0_9FLAO|nr:type IX secretion system membrane protein PorP/SprF [Abyssalbus ytuae]UOB19077.1 type IX secretion system membrane protein PorP/SprF [Abyssalbus ytuae]